MCPHNIEIHSGKYDRDMRAGKGFVQPDKTASFAAELIVLYKATTNPKYFDAATRIADTLTSRIQPGDGERSPWPYQVHAETDQVHTQMERSQTSVASYTSNYTGARGEVPERHRASRRAKPKQH